MNIAQKIKMEYPDFTEALLRSSFLSVKETEDYENEITVFEYEDESKLTFGAEGYTFIAS